MILKKVGLRNFFSFYWFSIVPFFQAISRRPKKTENGIDDILKQVRNFWMVRRSGVAARRRRKRHKREEELISKDHQHNWRQKPPTVREREKCPKRGPNRGPKRGPKLWMWYRFVFHKKPADSTDLVGSRTCEPSDHWTNSDQKSCLQAVKKQKHLPLLWTGKKTFFEVDNSFPLKQQKHNQHSTLTSSGLQLRSLKNLSWN